MNGNGLAGTETEGRVANVVADARTASAEVADASGRTVSRIIDAVGETLTDPETIARFGRLAAEETGRGHPDAKAEKVTTAVDGVRRDVNTASTVGIVDRDDRTGTLTIARPVGVVGAAVPATHAAVLPTVVSLFSLAGRNAVVFAPSPSTVETCDVVVETVRDALADVGAPRDLVSMLPAPAAKPETDALFESADLVCASGSQTTVAAGQRCGTPNHATSADGLVSVADGTVPAGDVATSVAVGATYDFGAHPAADAAVVTTSDTHEDVVSELRVEGGYVLTEREADRLRALMAPEGGTPEAAHGCSPRWLTTEIDLPPDARTAAFLVVDPVDRDDPLATLPRIPAVAVHDREGFGSALSLAADLGESHAAAVHTTRQRRVKRAAEVLRVGRLVINQPGTAAIGASRNGLATAPLLGGGVDEGSQLCGGLTVDEFLETTTVATDIEPIGSINGPGVNETWRGP